MGQFRVYSGAMGRDKRKRMEMNVHGIEELRNNQAERLGGSSTWRTRVPGARGPGECEGVARRSGGDCRASRDQPRGEGWKWYSQMERPS